MRTRDRLRRYGWDVACVQATEFGQASTRVLGDDIHNPSRRMVLINATRR